MDGRFYLLYYVLGLLNAWPGLGDGHGMDLHPKGVRYGAYENEIMHLFPPTNQTMSMIAQHR